MIIAIHQPNFFPWLGYFNKIAQADTFVFLDEVKYTRGSYINRVKIMNAGEICWMTCPVKCCKEDQINKVEISGDRWKNAAIRMLMYNYQKAPYFDDVFELIKGMILKDFKYLSSYNISNIMTLCDLLRLDVRFVRQSDLHTTQHSTELLVEIVKRIGGDTYLEGAGARGYQRDSVLTENGIKIIKQNVCNFNTLSIIDCLFNNGVEGTKRIITNE